MEGLIPTPQPYEIMNGPQCSDKATLLPDLGQDSGTLTQNTHSWYEWRNIYTKARLAYLAKATFTYVVHKMAQLAGEMQ